LAGNALDVADVALLLVEQQQEQLQVSQQAIREARERDSEMQEKLDEIHRIYPAEILSTLIEHQRGMLQTAAITAKKLEQEAGAAEVAGLQKKLLDAIKGNEEIQAECVICWKKRETSAFLSPCGHFATCMPCVAQLKVCPVCCQKIEKVHQAFGNC
jgi:hypothetical protein